MSLPKGTWKTTARDISYNNGVLKALLQQKDGSWIINKIRASKNDYLENINGEFHFSKKPESQEKINDMFLDNIESLTGALTKKIIQDIQGNNEDVKTSEKAEAEKLIADRLRIENMKKAMEIKKNKIIQARIKKIKEQERLRNAQEELDRLTVQGLEEERRAEMERQEQEDMLLLEEINRRRALRNYH